MGARLGTSLVACVRTSALVGTVPPDSNLAHSRCPLNVEWVNDEMNE